jgi:hypothetical protein
MKQKLLLTTALLMTLAGSQAWAQDSRSGPAPSAQDGPQDSGSGPSGNAPPERMEQGPAQIERGASSDADAGDTRRSQSNDDMSPRDKQSDRAMSERDRDNDNADNRADREPKSRRDADRDSAEKADGMSGSDDRKSRISELPNDKKTRVQSSFRSNKSRAVVRDIDVSINVGVAVPRSVSLYTIPDDIVVIVPAYRRYKYFAYKEKIVIVDPSTFEIVEVIIIA